MVPSPMPPFSMLQTTDMERFRYRTWATKEPETIAWIDSVRDGERFYDIGANVGIYTLYAAATHRTSPILAVEPDAKNFAHLRENVDANALFNVTYAHFAVSDRDGEEIFGEATAEIGGTGGQLGTWQPNQARYAIAAHTLDTLAKTYGVPAHVKIDIDGQELRVVRGMRATLANPALRSVLIEVDLGDPRDRSDIVDAFAAAGFTTANRFNQMTPHSRTRRAAEGIRVENVVFTREG